MKATTLLADARARGIVLQADDCGGLRVRWPGKQPIPELREALVAHKPEILRLLLPALRDAEAPAEPCVECGKPSWLCLVSDDGARTCIDCALGRTALRAKGVPI